MSKKFYDQAASEPATQEEIKGMSVPQLRQYAKRQSINLEGRDGKKDIQSTIMAFHGYPTDNPATAEHPATEPENIGAQEGTGAGEVIGTVDAGATGEVVANQAGTPPSFENPDQNHTEGTETTPVAQNQETTEKAITDENSPLKQATVEKTPEQIKAEQKEFEKEQAAKGKQPPAGTAPTSENSNENFTGQPAVIPSPENPNERFTVDIDRKAQEQAEKVVSDDEAPTAEYGTADSLLEHLESLIQYAEPVNLAFQGKPALLNNYGAKIKAAKRAVREYKAKNQK